MGEPADSGGLVGTSETALDLDAIKDALSRIADGPWFVESFGEFGEPVQYHIDGVLRWKGYLNVLRCDEDQATAMFIAQARTWVPQLVAEIERLRAGSGHSPEPAGDADYDRWDDPRYSRYVVEKMNGELDD